MATRTRGRPPHPDVLTPAEWTVLELWRHGLGRSVIAERRGISQYAVRYHLRNIAGKLGLEHYSELRHWPGFAADSLRKENSGMATGTKLALGSLGQVSLLTKDAAAAERWYKEVLELPHIFTFGDLVFFDCAGTRLYIRQMRGKEEWRPSSTLYFVVPDIQAAHEELTRRGVHFLGAPHMIYKDDTSGVEEWMAFFEDPDGNTLAVMARVAPADA
jgi:DNA-binding CsgD family transcriptional regulator/catechol 2,3-dioxygenase-like lactoylglutathione lyase family enzyme